LARLLAYAAKTGVHCAVDARGEYLIAALAARPDIVKVNASEAAEFTGSLPDTLDEALQAALTLQRAGASAAIVTMGNVGAAAAGPAGCWVAHAPQVETIAPVGSGDSFLGGLVLAISRNSPLPQALRLAIAAGAANAQTIGVAMIEASIVAQLAEQVILEERS
jgi:fructose-1-phosphate kinase PfkB-like protein